MSRLDRRTGSGGSSSTASHPDPDSKTNKAYQVGEVDDLYVGDLSSEATAAASLPAPAAVAR